MALFGKKNTPDDGGESDPPPDKHPPFSPENAEKFFAHARTSHEATNYEYAMQMWLKGLAQDPSSMRGLESFFRSAGSYLAENPKGKLDKDTKRAFTTRKSKADKYVGSLLDWSLKPLEADLAIKATQAASALELAEQAHWIGTRALAAAGREKKPSKDAFVKLMDAFSAVGDFQLAVQAGEAAMRVDPADTKLSAEVRNLAAQATMSSGGYETAGEAGGFRQNVRDLERQKQLAAEEKIVKTEETIERMVERAEADYASRPDDPVVVGALIKRLLERGGDDDEKRAFALAMKAHQKTGEFRFRQSAGDIKLRRLRRQVSKIRDRAERGDAEAKATYEKAARQLLDTEIEEYRARVDAYPTDLGAKFELGRRLHRAGRYEDAIAMFQESQRDARRRTDSLDLLAACFQAIGWVNEAVNTYRLVLETRGLPTEKTIDLRYGLMSALRLKAEGEQDLPSATEAEQIASSIAIQQINYRDIRQQRDDLKALVEQLKAAG